MITLASMAFLGVVTAIDTNNINIKTQKIESTKSTQIELSKNELINIVSSRQINNTELVNFTLALDTFDVESIKIDIKQPRLAPTNSASLIKRRAPLSE